MPRGLRQLAEGMLRIFATISRTMGMTSQTPSMNTTPQFEWLSRGDVVHELASSLLIEQRAIESTSEAQRVSALENDELLPPKKGSAPFRFELQRLVVHRFAQVRARSIDCSQYAPHFGLAFLQLARRPQHRSRGLPDGARESAETANRETRYRRSLFSR